MTVFAVLQALAGGEQSLRNLLVTSGQRVPALKPQIDDWLARLDAPLSTANLATLAQVLPAEARDILSGKIKPKDHPSDAI